MSNGGGGGWSIKGGGVERMWNNGVRRGWVMGWGGVLVTG